jgi:hypothetical protein
MTAAVVFLAAFAVPIDPDDHVDETSVGHEQKILFFDVLDALAIRLAAGTAVVATYGNGRQSS